MPYPVKFELYKNGYLFRESIAEKEDDLYCPIEMDTGTGWLDASPLYEKMQAKKRDQVAETIRVCHSYEKWGAMQQEVVAIKVRLQRLDGA